ncbi:MAG: PorP/SprF family type IX secretion system membrane protein [Marinilabiliaceae bacterium]|nr:PorP/SprF family type IX secretion system membrane protein [Marinilabiliaceae bacterium]
MIHCKKKGRFCDVECVLLAFFVLICISCETSMMAQNDVMLSQVGAVPSLLNPGTAGKSGSYEAVGAFRKQWVGFEGSPQSTMLGVNGEVAFLKNFHGIGAMVVHDKVGALTTMNIGLDYSFHIELSHGLLGLGLRVGVLNTAFNAGDLHPSVDGLDDDYHQSSDPLLEGSDDSGTALDIGFGAFYQSKRSYLGFSVLHLTSPRMEMKSGAIIKRRPMMALMAGRKLREDAELGIEARSGFQTDFSSSEFDVSVLANIRRKVSLGIGYRLQDAIFFQLGANLLGGIFVGYGYDLCLTDFRSYQSGSHEVVLSYSFNIDVERRTKRYKSVRML